MKEFVKKNFVLILGVSLPVLLILVFAVAQGLTKLVDPPEYTAVFALESQYMATQLFQFEVDEEGKLDVDFKFTGHTPDITAYNYFARVFLFDPKTNKVEHFDFRPPDDYEMGEKIILEVPEKLSGLILSSNPISPDDYVVEQASRSGGNIFTELFGYGNRYRYGYVLKKDGRTIPVPTANTYYGQFTFIGWVIEEDVQE